MAKKQLSRVDCIFAPSIRSIQIVDQVLRTCSLEYKITQSAHDIRDIDWEVDIPSATRPTDPHSACFHKI